jgi:hypothetical protein
MPAYLPFSSVKFRSRYEFEEYCQENRERLDGRYTFEMAQATKDAFVVRNGSCGFCMRRAVFTSSTAGGEVLPDGRTVPNWREQQICDCEKTLPSRFRAVLHFLQSEIGLQDWKQLLLLGPASQLESPLAQHCRVTAVSRLVRHQADLGTALSETGRYKIPDDDCSRHVVVSSDYLQHVPPLRDTLTEIRRVLMPGGSFVFTIPFHLNSQGTVSHAQPKPLPVETAGIAHEIGWDILDRLDEAGFTDAAVHLYWSGELGYLGPMNMIFSAIR